MTVSYPTEVWDGDSGSRDTDEGVKRGPDSNDWGRVIEEVSAIQKQLGVGADMAAAAAIGAVAGTGNTAVVDRAGVQRVVITLVDLTVAVTDEAGVVAYLGEKIYDFPNGAILMLGVTVDLAITKSSAGVNVDWDGDVGLGTVTADNDATLTATEDDIVPTTTIPQAVGGVVANCHAQSTAAENIVIDSTTTTGAADVFLNVLIDDLDQDVTVTPCDLIFNGTITLTFVNLGDY